MSWKVYICFWGILKGKTSTVKGMSFKWDCGLKLTKKIKFTKSKYGIYIMVLPLKSTLIIY